MTINNPLPRDLLGRIERKVKPDAIYGLADGAIVSLYRAKDISNNKWNHADLKALTLFCRRTFLRYGRRSLLDKYDRKAVIYLACASYVMRRGGVDYPVREWLSVRLVPGGGRPVGSGELEIYRIKGVRLDKIIRDKFFGGKKDFWRYVISGSRICGIEPYSEDQINGTSQRLSGKNKYTAACFALMFYQFLRDSVADYEYLIGIIQNRFLETRLVVVCDGKEFRPALTPAYKFLGLKSNMPIKLRRDIYAYKFPSYWLKMEQLIPLLSGLLKSGDLSEKTFRYYLGGSVNFDQISVKNLSKELPRLGRLLSVKGRIKGSKMTGARLRRLIDDKVEDKPELKITEIRLWNDSIRSIVAALRVKKM